MIQRIYHDPLHKAITIDGKKSAEKMVLELIDSEPFQRLRRIKQLGPAFLTFHGAESSRFTHSIGVFHLARKALKNLSRHDHRIKKDEGLLYASALLHDLGHAPFSHTGEEIFGLKHEQWSAKIIRENKQIKNALERYKKGTTELVARLIENKQPENKLFKSIISSQLDCDRFDYLMRDTYSTGTFFGQLDLDRIFSNLRLAPDGDIAIHPKGLMAVEHYLVVRNLMYRSVYNHRLNEVCNWLLEKIIKTAQELGPKEIWADKIMHKWLWEKDKVDIEIFLANDDIRISYHLQIWKENSPSSLSQLCDRFINRKLLKALPIDNFDNITKLNFLAIARKLAIEEGLEPETLCGIRYRNQSWYDPYKGGLRLWDENNLVALEEASELVKSLINAEESSWLIFPKEIEKELKEKINKSQNELT